MKTETIKNEKVLYYPLVRCSIGDMRSLISQFTIHNGCYPDYIDMSPQNAEELANTFTQRPERLTSMKFLGIPIRLLE